MISQKKANPIYNALAVFLLLSGAVLFISGPMIPKAHAIVPLSGTASNTCDSTSSCTTPALATTYGDALIVTASSFILGTHGIGFTITDNQSHSYTTTVSKNFNCLGTGFSFSAIYYTTTVLTGHVTVTITTNITATSSAVSVQDITDSVGSVRATGTSNAGCATTDSSAALSASLVYVANTDDFVGAGFYGGGSTGAAVSFTRMIGCGVGTVNQKAACNEYFLPNSGGSSNMAVPQGAGHWSSVGAIFIISAGPVPPVTIVYQVNACTFYQLQCWWYPLFFFGVGLAPFMLVGGLGRVNAKGMTYLLLAGLTLTSMIEVLMGMINVMFPLALTGLTIFYAVRSG